MLIAASLGSAMRVAADAVDAYPTMTTFAAIAAAIVGVLKMVGIGTEQYKALIRTLLAYIGVKIPGDTVVEKVVLHTLEQLLDALLDKLIVEEVPDEEVKAIFEKIAPAVQKARLARAKRAIDEKCDLSPDAPDSVPKGAPAVAATPATVEAL